MMRLLLAGIIYWLYEWTFRFIQLERDPALIHPCYSDAFTYATRIHFIFLPLIPRSLSFWENLGEAAVNLYNTKQRPHCCCPGSCTFTSNVKLQRFNCIMLIFLFWWCYRVAWRSTSRVQRYVYLQCTHTRLCII